MDSGRMLLGFHIAFCSSGWSSPVSLGSSQRACAPAPTILVTLHWICCLDIQSCLPQDPFYCELLIPTKVHHPPLPCLCFQKSCYLPITDLQPYELPHYFSVVPMISQLCVHTWSSSSSCSLPRLHAFGYRHLRWVLFWFVLSFLMACSLYSSILWTSYPLLLFPHSTISCHHHPLI